MGKINAVITGVGGYVPDYILNNEELSRMVDTTDEWITTRVGIKERRILTEEGLGTSYLARKAGIEERFRIRLLCSLLWVLVHSRCCSQHDSEWQIQENHRYRC